MRPPPRPATAPPAPWRALVALVALVAWPGAARADDPAPTPGAPSQTPVFAGVAARDPALDALAERAAVTLAQALEKRGVVDLGTPPLPVVDEADDPVLDNAVSAAVARYQEADFARALERADEAIARFERRAAFLAGASWAPYTRALLVKSLAERKLGRDDAADATLRRLAALRPKDPPDPALATPSLLERYQAVLDGLRGGPRVQIEVSSTPSGAQVVVDGEARGKTPVVVRDLLPGTHFVAVERDGVFVHKALDVTQSVRVDETLGDPRTDAAKALRGAVAARAAEDVVRDRARAIGDDVLFGVVVADASGVPTVVLARATATELLIAGTRVDDKSALKARLAPLADALLDGVASPEGTFIPEAPGSPRAILFEAGATPPPSTEADGGVSPIVVAAGVGAAVLVVGAATALGVYFALQAGEEVSVLVDASQL